MLKFNYICSLRAVEFLVTNVIIFFEHWRVVFQSLHNLPIFPVQLGLVNFNSRFLEMSSGVTVILLEILRRGLIKQFIFLLSRKQVVIEIAASYDFVHSVKSN